MEHLTRHDKRLLSGAALAILSIVRAGANDVELIKKVMEGAPGLAAVFLMLGIAEPDLALDGEVNLDLDQTMDTFRNNVKRLGWLGTELLKEDMEDMKGIAPEEPWKQ